MKYMLAKDAGHLTLLVFLIFLSACEKLAPKPPGQFALRFAHDGDTTFKTNQFELMSVPTGTTTNLLWVEKKAELGGESIRDVHVRALPSTTLQEGDVVKLHPENDASTNAVPNSVAYEVIVSLSERGQEVLRSITKENIGRRLVIVVNGKAIVAPRIAEPINTGGLAIVGQQYTRESAGELADIIRSCMDRP